MDGSALMPQEIPASRRRRGRVPVTEQPTGTGECVAKATPAGGADRCRHKTFWSRQLAAALEDVGDSAVGRATTPVARSRGERTRLSGENRER
jgi:hypothetical protein